MEVAPEELKLAISQPADQTKNKQTNYLINAFEVDGENTLLCYCILAVGLLL